MALSVALMALSVAYDFFSHPETAILNKCNEKYSWLV